MTDNVDLFADVAAALLVRLRAAFPVPVDVEVDMLADEALEGASPAGATPEAFVEATVLWLGAAGLIVFEAGQLGARVIERVGLTASGFLALQARDAGDEPIGFSLSVHPSPELRRDLVGRALATAR